MTVNETLIKNAKNIISNLCINVIDDPTVLIIRNTDVYPGHHHKEKKIIKLLKLILQKELLNFTFYYFYSEAQI